jgi:glycosyltransferase involved in cell wall biosynthesis
VKIYGWPGDNFGCCYYRIELPCDELTRRGHDVTWNRVAIGGDLDAMHDADVIVGQRVSQAYASDRWQCLALRNQPEYIRWLGRVGEQRRELLTMWEKARQRPARARLVFEIDDDLWNVPTASPVHGNLSRQPEWAQHLATNASVADTVVVTTEHLADVMRRHNPDVRVVPNFIRAALLDHERPRRNDGRVTVGWAGSPTHSMDWAVLDDELHRFIRKTRRVELHVMGAPVHRWSRIAPSLIRSTPWHSTVDEYARAVDFDIGLAPLADNQFNRSKSWIKALEYGALGIPVIASDVGPYRDYVRHGETGYLVRRPGDWLRYLRELTFDDAARVEMGAAGRRQAAENTIEKNGHLWEAVMTG